MPPMRLSSIIWIIALSCLPLVAAVGVVLKWWGVGQ
jgi:hypothetical protein